MFRNVPIQLTKTATPRVGRVHSLRAHVNVPSRLITSSRKILSKQLPRSGFINVLQTNGGLSVASRQLQTNRIFPRQGNSNTRRFGDQSKSSSSSSSTNKEIPNEERNEMVLTPGQKVAAGTRLTMYLGMAVAGITFFYFTARELFPTKMSANSVFNNAHNILEHNSELQTRFGAPIKTYGRDHGGHREGRRNFIEHSEYKSEEDGSNRTRVRFNLEGSRGNAFVFAEVSSDMPSGEFVYLLVQDKKNGRVFNVIDNRSMLMAKKMASGSKEGEEAFANLLGGGRSK